jgi:hypothetical protein
LPTDVDLQIAIHGFPFEDAGFEDLVRVQ